jgi:hypothetical protein
MRCHRKTICVRSTSHVNSPSPELALEFAPPIHSVQLDMLNTVTGMTVMIMSQP